MSRDVAAFACVAGSASAVLIFVFRGRRRLELLPLLVFVVAYLVTTAIGASMMRLSPALQDVMLLSRGIDPRGAPVADAWTYWTVLWLPIVIAPLVTTAVLAFAEEWTEFGWRHIRGGPLESASISPLALGACQVVSITYCWSTLYSAGISLLPSALTEVRGDYFRVIAQRSALMDTLGGTFYGVLYGVLPALCFAALFEARRRKRVIWRWLFVLGATSTLWTSVLTLQKSVAIVFSLLAGIGVLVLGRTSVWRLLVWGTALLLLLAGLQSYLLSQWGVAEFAGEVLLRMGLSYPYYVGLFPHSFPFLGPDWQGALFGVHWTYAAPNYNRLVSAAMWEGLPVAGAAPASAPVSAYVEGGIPYEVMTLIGIGVMLAGFGMLGHSARRDALRFSLFLCCIGAAYYLSQVPLLGALWQSYGLCWGILAIAAVGVTDWMVRGRASASM